MNIETQGLGAGSYPEPPEPKTKTIDVELTIRYIIKDLEVPAKWDKKRIVEDVNENMSDYIINATMEVWEVDIDE